MLIVLEGPRNTGKSTAAEMIRNAIGENAYVIKFQRTSRPAPPVFMTDFLSKHWLALLDSRSVCILDRFHLTEYVMRSLDKKVDPQVLLTTTHMIDYMLKNLNATTYILETDGSERLNRYKYRDVEHREKEWPRTVELDAAWTLTKKTFHISNVKVWPSNTKSDLQSLAKDAINYANGGKRLDENIPFLPPRLEVSELVAEVV